MRKLALLLIGVVVLAGCQTALITHKEALLEDAGFKATPADTPERNALLTALPPRQFVDRGYDTYIYADPQVCNCLYIGSESAYAKYLGRVHFIGGSKGPPASINTAPNAQPYYAPPTAQHR